MQMNVMKNRRVRGERVCTGGGGAEDIGWSQKTSLIR